VSPDASPKPGRHSRRRLARLHRDHRCHEYANSSSRRFCASLAVEIIDGGTSTDPMISPSLLRRHRRLYRASSYNVVALQFVADLRPKWPIARSRFRIPSAQAQPDT